MKIVRSKDGTPIAVDQAGAGPALILVDGALCHRAFGPGKPLAALLAQSFTVFTYDRRGRGESGDAARYAVERELEDLEAVIAEAGGSAFVCGVSSGAALALEASNHGLAIEKLALYEAPFIVDDSRAPVPDDVVERLNGMISADRRGDAVRLFMKQVGVPGVFIALMRLMPAWSKLKAVAHTLPYDMTIVHENQKGKPLAAGRWPRATAPTLVLEGGKSPLWMRRGMQALAGVLPHARLQTLQGQTHMVNAKVVAPVLREFFAG